MTIRPAIFLLPGLLIVAVAAPAAAGYRSAAELFDAMVARESERAEGVSSYVMDLALMGQPSIQYYERASQAGGTTNPLEIFRLVPVTELQQRVRGDDGGVSATMGSMAGALGRFGGASSGMPTGLMQQTADIDARAMIAERARIVGRDTVDGREAYLVKADDLNVSQRSDGAEIVIRSISLWIDTQDLVMRRMRMGGTVRQDGQSREIEIEKLDREFRMVPGSRMILPYSSLLRMAGMLGPKEQQEMAQARQQLASMPEEQKQMMQNMMGPRMEMMRSMAEDGTFEVETTVREIRINEGIEAAYARAATPMPGGMAMPGLAGIGQAVPPAEDTGQLEQARNACLQRKIDEAQAGKQKRKRVGKLLGAVGRIAGRHGGSGVAADVSRISADVYSAQATAQDLQSAAEALGISAEDIAACENP